MKTRCHAKTTTGEGLRFTWVIAAVGGLLLASGLPSFAKAAPRTGATAPVIRCVSAAGGGLVVQVEPPRRDIAVTVRATAAAKPARGRTDIAGRARVGGAYGASVFAAVGTTRAGAFSVGPCPVSSKSVGPQAFVPVRSKVKNTGPTTLGFGVGEVVVPAGAVNGGVEVRVTRAPKSLVTPGQDAPRSLSGPVMVDFGGAIPNKPLTINAVAPILEVVSGTATVQVLYQSAAGGEIVVLTGTQNDLTVSFQIPGPGTFEFVLAPGVVLPADNPLNAAPGPTPTAGASTRLPQEQELEERINSFRAEKGRGALQPNDELRDIARAWAKQLATGGTCVPTTELPHNPVLFPSTNKIAPDLAKKWRLFLENTGCASGVSMQQLHQDFINSPVHVTNYLNPGVDSIAVGVFVDDKGVVWVVQDFGDFDPLP